MSKITWSAISQKPIDQNKNKKMVSWRIYFYTFILVLDSKFKKINGQKSLLNFFDICKIGT